MLPTLLSVSVDVACATELLETDKAPQTRTARARFDFFIFANLRPNTADLKIAFANGRFHASTTGLHCHVAAQP
jgi:hypothetical protein